MSDVSTLQPIALERRDKALIATINAKMLDEKELRMLGSICDEAAADTSIAHVIVNLERVQIVPSLALGLFVRIAQQCGEHSRAFTLVGLNPRVFTTFSVTKLDRILSIADNVDAALRG